MHALLIVSAILAAKPFVYSVEKSSSPAVMDLKLGRDAHALAASPDQKQLAFGSGDSVGLARFSDGALAWSAKLGRGHVRGLAFSPDGQRLAAAAVDGVHLLDAATGRVLWRADGHPNPHRPSEPSAYSVAFTPDGSEVWSISPSESLVRRHASSTGASTGEIPIQVSSPRQLLVVKGCIAVAGSSGLSCMEPTGRVKWSHPRLSSLGALGASADGTVLLFPALRSGTTAVLGVNVADGTQKDSLFGIGEGAVAGMGFVTPEKLAAAVARSGVVIATGRSSTTALEAKVRSNVDAVPALVVGADGIFAVATKDRSIRVYRAE